MSPAQARLALLGALVTHHPVGPHHIAAHPAAEGFCWRCHCPQSRATRYGDRVELDAAIAAIRICSQRRADPAPVVRPAQAVPPLPFAPNRTCHYHGAACPRAPSAWRAGAGCGR